MESSACVACGRQADGYAFCANADCLSQGNAILGGGGYASSTTVVTLPDGTRYCR